MHIIKVTFLSHLINYWMVADLAHLSQHKINNNYIKNKIYFYMELEKKKTKKSKEEEKKCTIPIEYLIFCIKSSYKLLNPGFKFFLFFPRR